MVLPRSGPRREKPASRETTPPRGEGDKLVLTITSTAYIDDTYVDRPLPDIHFVALVCLCTMLIFRL